MLCKEIIEKIEASYPKQYAMEWDNVGLLVGCEEKEVGSIYVALDATKETVEAAVKARADMLITHHPMLFQPIRSIQSRDVTGARIMQIIKADISYYAMHTNYDVLRMGELAGSMLGLVGQEVLEVTAEGQEVKGIGSIAQLQEPIELACFCTRIKEQFGLEAVRVYGDTKAMIQRVAVAPGSGKSMIGSAICKQADVLVTGDIDHHEGMDAKEQGLIIVDAGHYGLEHIFIEDMRSFLSLSFPDIKVEAEPIRHPFELL